MTGCEGSPAPMLTLIEQLLTFKPNRIDHGGLHLLEHERVRFGVDFGLDLDGLWMPQRSHITVLFIHGNRHNLTRFREHYELFKRLELSCFAFDFPGYGTSGGRPSEASLYASARAALSHIQSAYGARTKNIAIYGCSLGGAVAIELAQHTSAGCLITESTFTNSKEIARYLYPYLPIRHLLPTRFANDSKILSIQMPKLFIHGEQDERVPVTMGHSLYKRAEQPKQLLLVKDAGHVDCVSCGGESLTRVVGDFVRNSCG
jgi:fermentation-respiration switch protein FrsA (DUF1100 family)